jgi:serralysin
MGETGSISNLTHTARTINLSRNYQNPVIFAQPLSYNGAAPATVRLDNITNNSFTVSVQEPNNEDGIHAAENLSFMVLEAGTWELADGTILEVGTTQSNQLVSQGWETVNFDADFDSNPVVMSQIQTLNGADFVRTRQDNITENGFLVGMEEEEANATSGHANETIGYMAMSGGSGNWSGLNYTAGYTGDRITDAWGTVNFGAGFTQTPQILASLATYDGADPAGIRRRSLNNNQVQFKVEEDTSADAEMTHTTENVSFLAIEGSGILSAVSIDPLAPMAQESPVLAGVQTLNATSSPDTFILGDATQSYYDNMGIQDYALILNFDSSEDVIQLHGSASDYQLGAAGEEVPQGTGIFLNNDELVGVVSGVSDLALNADYFSFV